MIWLLVVGEYADIDVYASIVAYTDLLNQRGKLARAYIPSKTPNYSVPQILRMKEYEDAKFQLKVGDEAIILDVSIPEVINKMVPDAQILELIDHHMGYEAYWQERLGTKAIIEPIGAVATSIFEWWGECWDYEKMEPKIAKLLLAAILDNTLNFNAKITTERDCAAAERLARIIGTSVDEFAEWYFDEVSSGVMENLEQALKLDCKKVYFPKNGSSLNDSWLAFGQIAIWEMRDLKSERTRIKKIMEHCAGDLACDNWLVNVISLFEKRNYLLASSNECEKYFARLLMGEEADGWLVTKQLYLRKEIMQKMKKDGN